MAFTSTGTNESESPDKIAEYQRGIRSIIAHCDGLSTPQVSEKMGL